jgi:N-acetyl sugar amidotransferase
MIKKCNKCVIPETAETLEFDQNGTCSVCKQIDYKNLNINWDERQKSLDLLLNEHKGKANYDCIVPYSGGKDSTFALWYLVKKKKLKPLVVRFDHNFFRNNIQENTERTISKLGVDIVTFKPNFNLVKDLMIESLIRRGDFCWHCHVGITAYPIRVAIDKKIPLVFYGEPTAEYTSYYSYENFEQLSVKKFNRDTNLGINAEDIFEMINERTKGKYNYEDIKPFIFPTERELTKNKIKGYYLGSFIPWDVREQVKIIKKELGWKGDVVEGIPPEYDYEKIECMMQGVRDYIKFLKRGFGRTSHLVSIDIRNNRKSRSEGEDLTLMYDGKRPKSLDLFLKIIDMNEDEFYETVKKHVIDPHKMPKTEFLKKNKSNIVPEDFYDWEKKFDN